MKVIYRNDTESDDKLKDVQTLKYIVYNTFLKHIYHSLCNRSSSFPRAVIYGRKYGSVFHYTEFIIEY